MLRVLIFLLVAASSAPAVAAHLGENLCPPASATHTAVATGSWQDATTWSKGVIPVAAAKVLIPAGITVTNHATTADVLWIHVAGKLMVCDHCDTQINVHTIYVPMGGSMNLGMPQMPCQGTTVLEFVPGVFLADDLEKLSLGLICHGEFMACGVEKTAWGALDGELKAGAMTLTLRELPYQWKVGDRILVAGTNLNVETPTTRQSEFRTITKVDTRTVTFTPKTTFVHSPWRPDLKVHVANLSRNVVIRSRKTTPIASRGHLMFMSSMNDIRYTLIQGLGRTDKTIPVTDPRRDASGKLIQGTDLNPRGRYADHNHKCGPLSNPARRMWNVVDGSPGWGMVNHASNCEWDNCITINCVGFGAGTEEGQERGHIRRHLSALNINPKPVSSGAGRESIGDFGVNGDGIWLQGGLVDVEDAVCFDNSGVGVHLFNSPLNNHPDYKAVLLVEYLKYPIEHDARLLDPDIYGTGNVPTGRVPVRVLRRVTAYNNLRGGLSVWYGHFNQFRVPTAIRNEISDITCWGAAFAPQVNLEYGSNTNLTNARIVGDIGVNQAWASITRRSSPVLLSAPNVTIRGLTIEGMQQVVDDFRPSNNHVVENQSIIAAQ